jgi:3-oxosteroid 1-dehydrogenase
MSRQQWDQEVDVLVCGSGAAGLSAALVAAQEGQQVLLCEKAAQIGGTTATSGGEIWIPGNRQSRASAPIDTRENAETYLDALIDLPASRSKRIAYLRSAPEAIDYLEQHSEVRFRSVSPHPDYHQHLPGSSKGGRPLASLEFDGRRLGRDFALVRPPMRDFMVLGGMMVSRDDIPPLLNPLASTAAFATATRLVLRYLRDRIRYPRGTRLVMGNALVARMLFSLRQKKVEIITGAAVVALERTDGQVVGAVVQVNGKRQRVRTRKGVILATGGFASDPALRSRYLKDLPVEHSLSFEGATGDGLSVATAIGAAVDTDQITPAYWMPASIMNWPDKRRSIFPHIRDRARPGLIAVNAGGRRFVNESASYHDFVLAMLAGKGSERAVPAFLICDRRFIKESGIGLIRPVWQRLQPYIDAGYLITAPTIARLAQRIGVDPAALEGTVARYNADAAEGTDREFGKGSTFYNRHYGDPSHKPNPCLRPIGEGPYFAVAVYPAPIGTAVGLRIDDNANVLDMEGKPIIGLYACGNDMASITGGVYPGPGSTIGPGIVFAYRAVMHLLARPE